MSATPSLNPVPRPPARGLPTVLPPTPRKSSSLRVWILLALVAGGAGAAYKFASKPQASGASAQTVAARTATVTSGSIRRVLRLTGSTSAKVFRSVAAPMMQGPDQGRNLVLMNVASSGTMVKKGDLVAEIDAQQMKDHVDDLDDQIAQLESQITSRKAQMALNLENLQQSVRVAKSRLDRARLDAGASEIRTPVDMELLKLTVEEADATYKELVANLPIQKESNTHDLAILELGQRRQRSHRERHRKDIQAFSIRAPIDGLVVMQSIRRGREIVQVQKGDEVAPAQPFMKIVDLKSMQVEATVSQVESEEMQLGQLANVSFDAFPGLSLKARVSNIGAIASPPARMNYFLRNVPVYLSILDSDKRVIPDLSTSNDIVVEQSENAPLIPLAAVESRDGKSFVRVKRGDSYETRQVKLGTTDKFRIAVAEGVREGEEVALDD